VAASPASTLARGWRAVLGKRPLGLKMDGKKNKESARQIEGVTRPVVTRGVPYHGRQDSRGWRLPTALAMALS